MKKLKKWFRQASSFLMDLLKHMKKLIMINVLLAAGLSIIWAFVQVYIDAPSFVNHIDCLSSTSEGIYMTLNSGSKEYVIRLDQQLNTNYLYSENKIKQKELLQIEDIASDKSHNIYLLTTIEDIETGEVKQQIVRLNTKSVMNTGKKVLIENLDQHVYFSKLIVKESDAEIQFNMLGIEVDGYKLYRQKWSQQKGTNTLTKQIDKSYKMPAEEKLHSLFWVRGKVGGITNNGELFISDDDKLSKVCIDGKTEPNYHILSASVDWDDNLYIVTEETGDIRRINIVTHKSQLMFWGREIIKGSTVPYSGSYKMAYQTKRSLVAATSVEGEEGALQLFVTNNEGKDALSISDLKLSIKDILSLATNYMIPLFFKLLVIVAIGIILLYLIENSPYVFIKLTCYILPIVAVGIISFSLVVIHLYRLQVESDDRKDIKSTSELLLSGIDKEKVEALWKEGQAVEESELSKFLLEETVSTRLILLKDDRLLVTMDEDIPHYYQLKHYVSPSEYEQYMDVIQSGTAKEDGNVIYKEGRHLVRLLPIKNDKQQVVAVLEVGENFLSVKTQVRTFTKWMIRLIAMILVIVILAVSLVIKQVLLPLKKIENCLKDWKAEKEVKRLPSYGYDEFSNIGKILNTLIAEKIAEQYDLTQVTQRYYSFIPKKFFGLLEKRSIQEMVFGTYKQMNKPLAITSYRYLNMLDKKESLLAQAMNNNFRLINKTVSQYDGVLNIDHRYFFDVTALYDTPHKALEASLIINENLYENNKEEKMEQVTFLDQLDIRLELGGEVNRIKPVFLAYRLEWLYKFLPLFRKMGCQVIATKEFIQEIDEMYKYRYIGYLLGPNEERVDLYDYYEGDEKAIREVKEATQPQFDEALSYFHKKDFYKARNLFLQVIKENKRDEIARWYILRCDAYCKEDTLEQELALLTYKDSFEKKA